MPEVCEVIIMCHYLISNIGNNKIRKIIEDNKVKKLNYPLTVTNIDTKGKFLWFELTDSKGKELYILNTFGLVGKWICDKDVEKYEIVMELDKKKIYFVDKMKLGLFEITNNKDKLIEKIQKLAPDFLKTSYTNDEFIKIFRLFLSKHKRKMEMPIVKLLMSQNIKDGIGSGLGNYLTPEILYHSKISPHRQLQDLTDFDLMKLNEKIQFVTKWCYLHNTSDYTKDILDYLDQHYKQIKNKMFPMFHPTINIPKTPFIFEVYQKKKDSLGNIILVDNIIGNRKTYWTNAVQK
jgi:formamidopyrimidine-DNA glycosylase